METTTHDSFGLIFDALDCGIIVLDQHQQVIAWNAWIAAASNIAKPDALGKFLGDLFPGRPLNAILAAAAEALEAGASSLLTPTLHPALLGLRTRAGQPLIHSISVRPIGHMGAFECLIQISDVTGATRRETVLRQRQNARYDAVMESAAEAILTLDDTGVIQGANAAAQTLFEIDRTALIGLSAQGLFLDGARWSQLQQQVLADGEQTGDLDFTVKRRNGMVRHLEASISRWSGGAKQFTTAFLRDVTDRLSAEKKLKTLNETLEQRVAEATRERDMVWRISQDLFVLTDLNLTCQSVNPAWTEHLGLDKTELEGASFEDFVHPDDVAAVKARLSPPHIRVSDFDIRMRAKGGHYVWYSWQFMAQGAQYYAAGRDINTRRGLEDQLRQSQKMEAVGQLTGGIAHDFNNMLAVVISGLNLIQRRISRNEPGVPELITAATEGAHKAATLTQRLLAFSRQQPLSPETLDVNRMVLDMLELLRRTLGEHVRLETAMQAEGGAIIADRSQLENVLVNLAVNARDAMPQGGTLAIETSTVLIDQQTASEHVVSPGEYVLIAVADTGTGMSPDVLDRAFDPFFTTKGVGKGTGLGLSQVFGFVKQSGGYVNIQSRLEHGTTIKIALPRHHGTPDKARQGNSHDVPNGRAEELILVVEDEDSVRELTVQMLEELDYSVVCASGGEQALQILHDRQDISLLLTDVVMPGMNGRELADAAAEIRPDLKVLFTSGYARDAIVSNGIVDPNVQLLQKPATLQALAQKLRTVLDA